MGRCYPWVRTSMAHARLAFTTAGKLYVESYPHPHAAAMLYGERSQGSAQLAGQHHTCTGAWGATRTTQ